MDMARQIERNHTMKTRHNNRRMDSLHADDPCTRGMNGPKQILMGVVLAAAAMVPYGTLAAGPAPVNLGSTAHFMILSGAAITSTGGGIINGDVGASPIAGSAIVLSPAQVNGTIYTVDATGPAGSVIAPALLTAAKGDLTTAYNDAAGRTPVPSGDYLNPNGGNIGSLNLGPGLYKFDATAYITGADVTLTGGADDVWIFQIGADLQVGSGIHVILAGGAQAKNIFWQVGTSSVIDTFAVFKGTILAAQAVTMKTSSTMEGRALAFTAGVTYNGQGSSLPSMPGTPRFTSISKTGTNLVTVTVVTTPNYLLTLQACPDLILTNWSPVASATPVASPWMYTDNTTTTTATQRYYRAYITY